MRFFYSIGIYAYAFVTWLASFFNVKAEKRIKGIRETKKIRPNPNAKILWIHCASLGEYEQVKPLLIRIKKEGEYQLLVSFFSPSGYEIRANDPIIDYAVYLPFDTVYEAKNFVQKWKPVKAIFVKYELWFHFIHQLHLEKIPTFLVDAHFRENHLYLKHAFFRKVLFKIDFIYLQYADQTALLDAVGIKHYLVCGDTRFDRVSDTVRDFTPLKEVEAFLQGEKCIIFGSTWPDDEQLFVPILPKLTEQFKVIIAPHQVESQAVKLLKSKCDLSILFSEMHLFQNERILIIDNIGMLSRIYSYSTKAYVGGAFRTGLHNILEPAVFGNQIAFGPKHQKFPEATVFIQHRIAKVINNSPELLTFFIDQHHDLISSNDIRQFMNEQLGASDRIYRHLKENF